MQRTLKILAIVAAVAAIGAVGQAMANCQNEGPYPVRQCSTASGTPAWFAPKPLDAGTVSATWWLLGAGNRNLAHYQTDPGGLSVAPVDGDGFFDTPNPGVFIGVDAGTLTAGPIDGTQTGGLELLDAVAGTSNPLAAGGLCFAASAGWGIPWLDGCPDQNRYYAGVGVGVDASDNYLNRYWHPSYGGQGTLTDASLVDSPMGTLLTESNSKYFAVAFFSSTNRGQNPNAVDDSGYDMGGIVNGDPNPAAPSGNNNIVPWQPIPQPQISAVVDPNGNRVLSLSWHQIRVIRDNSSRPNATAAPNAEALGRPILGRDRLGNPLTGVGIMEQPELVSYVPETKPIVGLDCDPNAPWVAAGPAVVPPLSTPDGAPQSTSLTVPPDTCIRLTTRFGRVPAEAFITSPATATSRNQNRAAAQVGNLGDIGFNVSSTAKKIGGPLLGDKAVLKRATFNKQTLVVEFETLGELAVQSFQVVAKDRKGATSVVATVECAQCSSGIGSDYRVEVPGTAMRSAKSVFVVVQPSGTASNEIEISQQTQRPETPGRGRTNR
jgi:hypothetical protein